jgi:hypothetical protein
VATTTPKKPKPYRETRDLIAGVSRMLSAIRKRTSRSRDDLADLIALRAQLDEEIRLTVYGLRGEPECCSWAEIGDMFGISRQAAQQRFGGEGVRTTGGQPAQLR